MTYKPADLPVTLLYNQDHDWLPSDIQEVETLAHTLAKALSKEGHPIEALCLENEKLEELLVDYEPDRQIVFNWCEEIPGIPHSSDMVARILETLGFTFTGADSRALGFSQDKPAVKLRLSREHIPTPAWQIYWREERIDWNGFPAIVKPAYEHCSFGITHEAVVHNDRELSKQIVHIIDKFHQPVLVEDFVDGREFHVSVVGNGKLQVLPIAEMDFSAIREDRCRLCTYDSKFSPASSDYQMIQLKLPANLSAGARSRLEKTAIAAYRAVGCRDYARLDIRERDDEFYVLDVNPNADISPDTSVALSAELAGYTHGQFGSLLINLAAHRHPVFGHKEKRQVRPALPAVALTN
jgi:D-alanine-D-alanine ligase